MGMIKLPNDSIKYFEENYREIFESGNLAEGKWSEEIENWSSNYTKAQHSIAVNSNGAGDALAAMMLYLLSKEKKMDDILKTSVACGSYYANGNSLTKKSDYLKVKNLSKKVKIQKV